ncbi:hypothetical protein FOA52_015115 [Chlamydomonas sp. UWO 241]|nr:hypothetical protein FOA52_015115 [Chlamydomonas sp. UWO 241]
MLSSHRLGAHSTGAGRALCPGARTLHASLVTTRQEGRAHVISRCSTSSQDASFSTESHRAQCHHEPSASPSSSPSGAHRHSIGDSVGSESLYADLRSSPFYLARRKPLDLLLGGDEATRLVEVHVILFTTDDHDQEGIYSLKAAGEDGLPIETIVAFQEEGDAVRYASLLEHTMEPHVPQVCSVPVVEIIDFCLDHQYRCQVELFGSCLMPPEFNVGITDWERARALRAGLYAVLATEPGAAGSLSASAFPDISAETSVSDDWGDEQALFGSVGSGGGGGAWGFQVAPTMGGGSAGAASGSGEDEGGSETGSAFDFSGIMGTPELDAVRAALEDLLPSSESDEEEEFGEGCRL